MNRSLLLTTSFAALAFGLCSCDNAANSTRPAANPTPSTNPVPVPTPIRAPTPNETPTPAPAPNNTGRNAEDAGSPAKTPLDQSNQSSDIDITASIRRALMTEDSLSTDAKNCKIVTDKGIVTLRGPVRSQMEKDLIGTRAKAVSGVVSVDNQLEIKMN